MPPETNDRFDQLLREWARRPPATPADEAARAVLRRLPEEDSTRPDVPIWRLTAAAAAVVFVLATFFYEGQRPIEPLAEDVTLGFVEAPLVPDGVALIVLDSGTPLYLTLEPPERPEGDPSS